MCVSPPGSGRSPSAQFRGETLKKNYYFYVCFMAHFSHYTQKIHSGVAESLLLLVGRNSFLRPSVLIKHSAAQSMQPMYCSSQVSIFHQQVYWGLFSPYLRGLWKCQPWPHTRTGSSRCCVIVPLSASSIPNMSRDKR